MVFGPSVVPYVCVGHGHGPWPSVCEADSSDGQTGTELKYRRSAVGTVPYVYDLHAILYTLRTELSIRPYAFKVILKGLMKGPRQSSQRRPSLLVSRPLAREAAHLAVRHDDELLLRQA